MSEIQVKEEEEMDLVPKIPAFLENKHSCLQKMLTRHAWAYCGCPEIAVGIASMDKLPDLDAFDCGTNAGSFFCIPRHPHITAACQRGYDSNRILSVALHFITPELTFQKNHARSQKSCLSFHKLYVSSTYKEQILKSLLDDMRPSLDNVERAVHKLNNNSSTGQEGIKAKRLNIKEPNLIKEIHVIITSVWTAENAHWVDGSICPIYKKGEKS
ncbi:hypothetical protein TNCV_899091 [Trichonephila clavipes]|nr:hypothetical protein TNCV_899091 [Trichonephila clavipes]